MSSIKTLKLLAFTLAFVAGSVQAGLIQLSSGFSNQETNSSNFYFEQSTDLSQVTIAKFDSALGNLTGVDIRFESNWFLSSSVTGSDTHAELYSYPVSHSYSCGTFWSPQTCHTVTIESRYKNDVNASINAESQLDIYLAGIPGGLVSESSSRSLSSGCSESYGGSMYGYGLGCNDYQNGLDNFDGTLSLAGISLSNFIAANPSDMLSFSLSNRLATHRVCGAGDSCNTRSTSRWTGRIFVDYNYSQQNQSASVPEPSIIALFSLGLLGLGLSRRRKK
jgi:hypothetical protein